MKGLGGRRVRGRVGQGYTQPDWIGGVTSVSALEPRSGWHPSLTLPQAAENVRKTIGYLTAKVLGRLSCSDDLWPSSRNYKGISLHPAVQLAAPLSSQT